MKKFDTDKFNSWVKEQGGWYAVIDIAKDKAKKINCDAHVKDLAYIGNLYKEYPQKYTPFGGKDSALLWFCLNLNIDDFLKNEIVDGKTALKVLANGGRIKVQIGDIISYNDELGFCWQDADGNINSYCLGHKDNLAGEVISWGDYKHDK